MKNKTLQTGIIKPVPVKFPTKEEFDKMNAIDKAMWIGYMKEMGIIS